VFSAQKTYRTRQKLQNASGNDKLEDTTNEQQEFEMHDYHQIGALSKIRAGLQAKVHFPDDAVLSDVFVKKTYANPTH